MNVAANRFYGGDFADIKPELQRNLTRFKLQYGRVPDIEDVQAGRFTHWPTGSQPITPPPGMPPMPAAATSATEATAPEAKTPVTEASKGETEPVTQAKPAKKQIDVPDDVPERYHKVYQKYGEEGYTDTSNKHQQIAKYLRSQNVTPEGWAKLSQAEQQAHIDAAGKQIGKKYGKMEASKRSTVEETVNHIGETLKEVYAAEKAKKQTR
jgi:hypothetical protein